MTKQTTYGQRCASVAFSTVKTGCLYVTQDELAQLMDSAIEIYKLDQRATAEPAGESDCPKCKAPFFISENGCACCGHK